MKIFIEICNQFFNMNHNNVEGREMRSRFYNDKTAIQTKNLVSWKQLTKLFFQIFEKILLNYYGGDTKGNYCYARPL